MSPLEDEIRATLRSEATRLREVRPLHLRTAGAPSEPRTVPGTHRSRWLSTWLAPAVAAAAVVLVAAALVTLRSLGNGHTADPAASPGPIAGPALAADAIPRYYVQLGRAGKSLGPGIIVGDEQARKTIGTFPFLPKGKYTVTATFDGAVTGAADDRTFVVTASVRAKGQAATPLTWYLVRIYPGSADPVRVTKLPIEFPPGRAIKEIALSGDGTELAVVSVTPAGPPATSWPLMLQVYSVATGRLQRSWSAGIRASVANPDAISDLSWVGDSTVGFAVTYTRAVREEVRTVNVSASGPDLLADSRVVWSQYVPPSPLTAQEKATILALEPSSHACDTPFLTANGQAVVCGNSTYSASDKRLSAVWLAYPLAAPTRPRVLGSVEEPRNVSAFDGKVSVDWSNPSGTEIIGSWNPTVITGPSNNPAASTTNDEAYIGNGTVKTFPYILGGIQIAW